MTTTEVALPTTGDVSAWSDSEKALVEAAGLTSQKSGQAKTFAPRPVVEAFLMQCRRTGLDPIARQIYCIQRAGKWQTQVSIDGARLVAERSGDYEGQTAPQWSDDGRTWYDAWVTGDEVDAHPRFARVGVYRTRFREALYVVARWESYAVYEDVWSGGQKTGEKKLSSMWKKMPDLMLAKVAEMLALRKAFPQDLSGLYSTEEMQQADRQAAPQPTTAPASVDAPPQPEPVPVATADWAARILDADSVDDLRTVYDDAEKAAELGRGLNPERKASLAAAVEHFDLPSPPADITVGKLIAVVKIKILNRPPAEPESPTEDIVDAEVVEGDAPTDRVTEWPTAQPGSGGRTVDPETGEELI